METFKYTNLNIKYISSGEGQVLIFLHNGGTSHVIWNEIISELLGEFKIFALDLLGYGESSKPDSKYDLNVHVDILTQFIAYHQLKNVIIIGNCMGSAISLRYAAENTDNVKSLIVINPLTTNTFSSGKLGFFLRLRKFAPRFSRIMYQGMGKIRLNKFFSKQAIRLQLGAIGKGKKLEQTNELYACFTRDEQVNSLLLTLDDLVNYSDLDKTSYRDDFPPICTIWGLENKVLSAKSGKVLNKILKPKREEWIEKGGHLVMVEEPIKIAKIIREFSVFKK